MNCPCCEAPATRATHLPEIRGWLRPGDCFCPACRWVFPRELAGEAPPAREACPEHGAAPAGGG